MRLLAVLLVCVLLALACAPTEYAVQTAVAKTEEVRATLDAAMMRTQTAGAPTRTKTPTATPIPTQTLTPSPTLTPFIIPTDTPRAGPAQPDFVTVVKNTRRQVEIFGGIIDIAAGGSGTIDCHLVVSSYEAVAFAPTLNVSSSLGGAYQLYRNGVSVFATKARDMYQHCKDFLAGIAGADLPFQQWGPAREGVNEAGDLLRQAIVAAGGTP